MVYNICNCDETALDWLQAAYCDFVSTSTKANRNFNMDCGASKVGGFKVTLYDHNNKSKIKYLEFDILAYNGDVIGDGNIFKYVDDETVGYPQYAFHVKHNGYIYHFDHDTFNDYYSFHVETDIN